MAKKPSLQQIEMFDLITESGLSVNQYYLLVCIHNNSIPKKANTFLERRHLLAEEWIMVYYDDYKLIPKALELIEKVEKIYCVAYKRSATQMMGKDYKEKIDKYIKMFPQMKLPSGSYARQAPGNVTKAFVWFFNNHTYSWDIIFKATVDYLADQEVKNWKFCRTSQFFIRKNDASDLANKCEIIKSGVLIKERDTSHRVNVV